MNKNTTTVFALLAAAFAVIFGGNYLYSKMADVGTVNYLPAGVGSLFQKDEPIVPSVTLTFAGDIMLDRGVERSVTKNFAGDFSQLFKNAESFFQSDDITFLNLEGPVSDKGYIVGSIYSFEMNPIVLPIIKNAGVDTVSFANNHVGDYTKAAFTDTLDRLTAAGISYSGAGKTYEEASSPTIVEKNGMKVGYLAFTDVGPNWLAAKTVETQNATGTAGAGILLASDPNFSQIISSAKTKVDVLVVSFHWGDEYKPHNARQAKLAHAAVDAGADIIAGHHPHVAQDTEMYKNKLIIYSMGNFIFDQYFSKETMQGLVVRATISKDGTISSVKEYTSQLNSFYAIESITEKASKLQLQIQPAESNANGNAKQNINQSVNQNGSTETNDNAEINTEVNTETSVAFKQRNIATADITFGWVGDIPPSNTTPTFDDTVLSWLKSPDLMAGNLEGALSNTASTKCGSGNPNCFSFVGNSSFATALSSSGFDIVNLANNHALDKGEAGIATTKSKLSAAKLFYSPLKDNQEMSEPSVVNIKGIDVAFLSFGHNAWTTKITDIEKVKELVASAAAKYSVVVVFFHGGAEGSTKTHVTKATEYYIGENRGNVYVFAHAAIDSGADLVLGSGPHVVRGIEKYNDRLIAYSAGNFMTTEGMSNSGILGKAAVFNITTDQNGAFKNLSILSTTGQTKNAVSLDPTNEMLNKIIELTKQDFGQTIAADADGNIQF